MQTDKSHDNSTVERRVKSKTMGIAAHMPVSALTRLDATKKHQESLDDAIAFADKHIKLKPICIITTGSLLDIEAIESMQEAFDERQIHVVDISQIKGINVNDYEEVITLAGMPTANLDTLDNNYLRFESLALEIKPNAEITYSDLSEPTSAIYTGKPYGRKKGGFKNAGR
jgi:hypothetical protein